MSKHTEFLLFDWLISYMPEQALKQVCLTKRPMSVYGYLSVVRLQEISVSIVKSTYHEISQRLHHFSDAQLQVSEEVLFSLNKFLNDFCPALHLPRTQLLWVNGRRWDWG